MWCFEDQAFSLVVEFLVDGEYVIPSSASASLRGNDGTELTSFVLTPSTTQETVQIEAQYASIAAGLSFENRFLLVTFVHEGQQHIYQTTYRVVPFVPLTATPSKVRSLVGLDFNELPDEDIDVFGAYLRLDAEYEGSISAALTAGTTLANSANRAVALKAALLLVDSFEFRVAVELKAEDSSVKRQGEFEIRDLKMRLGKSLSAELNLVLGEETTGQATFLLATPTDVITGE